MSTKDVSARVKLEALAQALADRQEPLPSDSKKARGAVAVFLKEEADDLWFLMIRRSERPHDPWSGQMGFPGGHAEAQDRTLFDTVAREAIEEVGIDIRNQKFLGCLPNVQPRNAPMMVSPFIFLIESEVDPRTGEEAEEIVWIPLSFLSNPKNISSFMFSIAGKEVPMPCYNYSNHIIWGMSFRIIREIVSKASSGV